MLTCRHLLQGQRCYRPHPPVRMTTHAILNLSKFEVLRLPTQTRACACRLIVCAMEPTDFSRSQGGLQQRCSCSIHCAKAVAIAWQPYLWGCAGAKARRQLVLEVVGGVDRPQQRLHLVRQLRLLQTAQTKLSNGRCTLCCCMQSSGCTLAARLTQDCCPAETVMCGQRLTFVLRRGLETSY